MIILGLHFGHDASISVLEDGIICGHYARERHARIKHAIGLTYADVQAALAMFGLCTTDIDYCGVTTTQDVEYLFFDEDRFSFRIRAGYGPQELSCGESGSADVLEWVEKNTRLGVFRSVLAEQRRGHLYYARAADLVQIASDVHRLAYFPPLEDFGEPASWRVRNHRQQLPSIAARIGVAHAEQKGFRRTIVLAIDGHEIPGCVISHHLAHAACGYYESPFRHALILTQDGGGPDLRSYLGGMYYLGRGNRILPLCPHYLDAGAAYVAAAECVGFRREGSEGKLMGLASYGQPRFDDGTGEGVWELARRRAKEMGYAVDSWGDCEALPNPLAADIAASAQSVLERSTLEAAERGRLHLASAGEQVEYSVMVGGVSLNCPMNSRMHQESSFSGLHVPPACGDDGLSIGACYLMYYEVLGHEFHGADANSASQVYRGPTYSEHEIEAALEANRDGLKLLTGDDPVVLAAKRLAANEVLCWFDGRSEIGPRALGHRSILADPRLAANTDRVNAIKGREKWRPLAPSVLSSECANWFAGLPPSSPFMLFTGRVISNALPAITHVDGTARVQTVDEEVGDYHRLLRAFSELAGVPVLLNTSFNGPGEPIVESPKDAIRFFLESDVRCLFIQGRLVEKHGET